MKKLSILLVVVLLVSAFSVNVFADDGGWLSNILGDDEKKDDGKIVVGFLLKTMQEERYAKDKKYFIEYAKELGADEVIFDSANNDPNMQHSKFENMLAQDVDVIALQPIDPVAAGRMVEMAHEEGVAVVAYDMLIKNCDLDVFVTPNGWKVGELQGEAMVEWFKEHKGEVKGNVVLLRGQPGGSNVPIFSKGVYETIEEYEGLELVVDQGHENWSPNLAMQTVENALTKYDNNIDAIVSNNSGMASGAVKALEAQGLADTDKVFLGGSDADLLNIRYIVQGKQTMEVFKKIKPLARQAAEVAVKLAQNPDKKIDEIFEIDRYVENGQIEVPTMITEIVPVNKDNIHETVIDAGFHAEEDIYDNE